jgi:phenylalanyl-tRNA synthetase alpha chain
MLTKIKEVAQSLITFPVIQQQDLEAFRIHFLSKKGIISELFEEFRTITPDQKKLVGEHLNSLKKQAFERYELLKSDFLNVNASFSKDDYTKPSVPFLSGQRHPVSIIRREIAEIFSHIGFVVHDGPEIEDDWHVFTGLNFPLNHPARDMQDTFFISKTPDVLLRTHTSSVQVRVMEKQKPPIRSIFPGRVFRNESISARAHCIFHQVEGLYIDQNVSFADLKQTLIYFAKEMFGEKTEIRLRPSFFPFTEPSAEMDVSCSICAGKGCNVCKYTGFLEILGCGMVDPHVLDSSSIDSYKYTGFAFGMGIERIAMLKYQINDLRLFFENDMRFLQQFTFS